MYNQGHLQVQEQGPVRGYFSSVDQRLFFGLGTTQVQAMQRQEAGVVPAATETWNVGSVRQGVSTFRIDSIEIVWPDERRQVLIGVPVDTLLVLTIRDARQQASESIPDPAPVFTEASTATHIAYQHTEGAYNDFANQRLLPQKYSQLGPFLTAADVNKDGLMDFFVGGAFNFSGQLFIQDANGHFTGRPITNSIKMQVDQDCTFLDADADGDMDLLISVGMFALRWRRYTTSRYYT
ncbi:ASPIC/UnbV domain-containing protein [Paraflavitalea speifideaquila]|uniref:ASPIC/UnbV domain-containing protein n=1 Tax=Paraflavitalea speifideaquila TaxID=3076558 RepID=UPI0028E92882|nr:ASPIC/UnbV domain-containing protein [Paraflavitalea speifideiaquila]